MVKCLRGGRFELPLVKWILSRCPGPRKLTHREDSRNPEGKSKHKRSDVRSPRIGIHGREVLVLGRVIHEPHHPHRAGDVEPSTPKLGADFDSDIAEQHILSRVARLCRRRVKTDPLISRTAVRPSARSSPSASPWSRFGGPGREWAPASPRTFRARPQTRMPPVPRARHPPHLRSEPEGGHLLRSGRRSRSARSARARHRRTRRPSPLGTHRDRSTS